MVNLNNSVQRIQKHVARLMRALRMVGSILSFCKRPQGMRLLSAYANFCNFNPHGIYFMHNSPCFEGGGRLQDKPSQNPFTKVQITDPQDEGIRFFKSRPVVKEITRILNQITFEGKVIDVGCAGGEWTRYLNYLTDTPCVGVDVDPAAIDLLNLYNNNRAISYLPGEVQKLPFDDGEVSLVFVSGVIQYVSDLDAALKELYRVTNDYVLIGRNGLFKHESESLVYQDGLFEVNIRNFDEFFKKCSKYFDLIDSDYSSEIYFVQNMSEPVICSHFLFKKKLAIS